MGWIVAPSEPMQFPITFYNFLIILLLLEKTLVLPTSDGGAGMRRPPATNKSSPPLKKINKQNSVKKYNRNLIS